LGPRSANGWGGERGAGCRGLSVVVALFLWVKRKTQRKNNTERHGAIDRKRGVKTPTKA
jgi:hypothetical protein